jgi:hypothetical protein
MQINVGKCATRVTHCHVMLAPNRKEIMTLRNDAVCLDALAQTDIATWWTSNGASGNEPPDFRWFFPGANQLAGPQGAGRPTPPTTVATSTHDRLSSSAHGVAVARCPCYTAENTQRGDGALRISIKALKMLAVGYGPGLALNLVFNPAAKPLPGLQVGSLVAD